MSLLKAVFTPSSAGPSPSHPSMASLVDSSANFAVVRGIAAIFERI